MNLRGVFLWLLVAFMVYCLAESRKKHRGRQKKRNLRAYCKEQKQKKGAKARSAFPPGSALELHAYFDLNGNSRGIACLKVTACEGTPVCFVTTHPHLRNKSINDSTAWQDLINFIQKDRRIEPIYDHSMDRLNGDKYKALSQYVQPIYQPAILKMCQGATVYRFVSSDNGTNITQPVSGPTTPPVAVTRGGNRANSNPIRLCPMLKRNRKRNKHNINNRLRAPRANNLCTDLNCACERICVGQGKSRQNFSDCSTFKIICTFHCNVDLFPLSTVAPTKKPKRNRKSRRQRHRQRKKNKGQ